MALSKDVMAAKWAKRKALIDEMFQNGTDSETIFNELCCSVYAGNEFNNVPGIIESDIDSLIDILCHIIIADYAMNSALDCNIITLPDHSEILVTICGQLKRNSGVDIQTIYDAVDKADTANWFISHSNERSMVHLSIKEIWDRA